MKAYEILSQPDAWTKGRYAETRDGKICNPRSKNAARWCMLGAIDRAMATEAWTGSAHSGATTRICMHLRDVINTPFITTVNIAQWNDAPERTVEEVVAVLRHLDL